jgi:hypothetical protein
MTTSSYSISTVGDQHISVNLRKGFRRFADCFGQLRQIFIFHDDEKWLPPTLPLLTEIVQVKDRFAPWRHGIVPFANSIIVSQKRPLFIFVCN